MKPTITQPSNPQSVDRKVLLLLRRKGAQTIESLSRLTGIGWGPVYKSVDRLSRSGQVSLAPVYPNEYRVSLSAGPLTRMIQPQPRPAGATFPQLSRADLLYA
ncbi:MAG: winged helix-turn-helix domain-containing protein [Nitrospirae bacterium]|nr:winged helix-turn-helix domain-containing protein [Nitrospirota bacterium]